MFKPLICISLTLAAGLAFAQAPADGRDARRAEWQARADARFAEADKNGDGQLDRTEAQAWGDRFTARFDDIDADRNGRLGRDELAQARGKFMREHRGGRGHGRGAAMAFQRGLFKGMDDNGDGAIDRAELGNKVPKWVEHFDVIDANKDGRIDRQELRDYRRAVQEQRRAERDAKA